MSRKKTTTKAPKKVTASVTAPERLQDVFPQSLADALGIHFQEPKPLTAKEVKAEDAAYELLKNSDRYMVGTDDQVEAVLADAQSQGFNEGLKAGTTLPRTPGELRLAREKGALSNVLQEVFIEAQSAIKKHGPMHSPHEGLGVIMEEFDELKEEIYADRGKQLSARAEAIQLAAMAVRYVLNVNPR